MLLGIHNYSFYMHGMGGRWMGFNPPWPRQLDIFSLLDKVAELGLEGEIEDDDPLFRVEFLSPKRMQITYSGLIFGVGKRSDGTAVRID